MKVKEYERLIDIAAKSGNGDDPRVQQAILDAVMKGKDKYIDAIEYKLRIWAEVNPNEFPKNKEDDFSGTLRIGKTSWGSTVRLKPYQWVPASIKGATRTGKSSFIARLFHEIKEQTDAALLALDPKRSLRSLTKTHDDIYAVRIDKFPFNPFSAVGELTTQWLQDFAAIIAQTGDLLTGSRSFILSVLDSLKEKFEKKERPPTMYDFLEEGKEKQSQFPRNDPSYRYGARFRNRIESMLFSFQDTFSYKYGFSAEELLNPSTNLILEADGLEPAHTKAVFLEILFSIYYHQMKHDNRGEGIDIFVFIDEAEEILGHSAKNPEGSGVPMINRIWERGTELKIGLISAVHHTRVSPIEREGSKSRFCFNLSSAEDIQKVARDFGLTEDQRDAIEDLEAGEAVAKLKGQLDDPFKLNVDYFPLEPVSDEEIKEDNKNLWAKVKDQIEPIENKPQNKKAERESKEDQEGIDKTSHVLLENIAKFPYLSITQRKEKLGWSNSKLNNTRKKLRQRGFTRDKRLNTGGRGGTRSILEISGKARKYVRSQGIKPRYVGRGGAIHSFWMQKFLDYYEDKNLDISTEENLNGSVVDLFTVKSSGKTRAIEIEVSQASNTLGKIRESDLLEEVDELLIVCNRKTLIDDFEEGLDKLDIDRSKVEVKKAQDIDFE